LYKLLKIGKIAEYLYRKEQPYVVGFLALTIGFLTVNPVAPTNYADFCNEQVAGPLIQYAVTVSVEPETMNDHVTA
jgi:hypothetical protein